MSHEASLRNMNATNTWKQSSTPQVFGIYIDDHTPNAKQGDVIYTHSPTSNRKHTI